MLMGPPGSGKGTPRRCGLSCAMEIPHVSTGDILRQAVRDNTPLGRKVAATIARGALVSDDLIADLVNDRLAQPQAPDPGFLLDGFPRTVVQARVLDTLIGEAHTMTILLEVDQDAIVRRLSSRRICNSCGLTQSFSDERRASDSFPTVAGRWSAAKTMIGTIRHRLSTCKSHSLGPVAAHYRIGGVHRDQRAAATRQQVSAALFAAIDAGARRAPTSNFQLPGERFEQQGERPTIQLVDSSSARMPQTNPPWGGKLEVGSWWLVVGGWELEPRVVMFADS